MFRAVVVESNIERILPVSLLTHTVAIRKDLCLCSAAPYWLKLHEHSLCLLLFMLHHDTKGSCFSSPFDIFVLLISVFILKSKLDSLQHKDTDIYLYTHLPRSALWDLLVKACTTHQQSYRL